MTATSDKEFFATQIAHIGVEDPEVQIEKKKIDQIQAAKEESTGLKYLLVAFNGFDMKQKGMITVQQAKSIFALKNVPVDKFDVHYKISMPSQNGFIAFDEFLFVFGLCQETSLDVEQKYEMCKKVDNRLVEFLRLLNNYRKKSENQANYVQAKKSKQKIEEIRQRQLQRRRKYLAILHEHELAQLQDKQKQHFEEFCTTWDQFMMDYQKTAGDLIKKLQDKHEAELNQFAQKNRDQLNSKVRFSKHIIELEAREKTLVKLQEYDKAQIIKQQIENQKADQLMKKHRIDEEILDGRCSNLKKQQLSAINSLLQNIQKDRNDQLKQRKQDSEKLIIRNKSMITEINHRHAQALKKIYDSLHNISMEGQQKSRVIKRPIGTS